MNRINRYTETREMSFSQVCVFFLDLFKGLFIGLLLVPMIVVIAFIIGYSTLVVDSSGTLTILYVVLLKKLYLSFLHDPDFFRSPDHFIFLFLSKCTSLQLP